MPGFSFAVGAATAGVVSIVESVAAGVSPAGGVMEGSVIPGFSRNVGVGT
jgi:hypothetical protein